MDDGLSEREFGMECLSARGEDRHSDGSDADRQVRGGTDGVVAAGCQEEQKPGRKEAEAHKLLSHWSGLWGMCKIGAGAGLGDALDVGVFECSWVFEPVAQGAVERDMAYPNQRYCDETRLVLDVAEGEEAQWEGNPVAEVVKSGSGAGIRKVAKHRDVRDEKENGEEQPAETEVRIEQYGGRQQKCVFQTEQKGRTSQHTQNVTF